MSSYNRITLVGILNADPEMKTIGKKKKSTFILIVERYVGVKKTPVGDYFNIVAWGKLAEVCGSYLIKGKKVLIDGQIQVRTHMNNGERIWITEIIAENIKFLSGYVPVVKD